MTGRVKEIIVESGRVVVTVEYLDDAQAIVFVQTLTLTDKPSDTWLAEIVKSTIRRLEALAGIGIVQGPVDTSAVPDPVADPADLVDLRRRLKFLPTLNELIAVGALAKTDTVVVNFVNAIKAVLPTYWGQL